MTFGDEPDLNPFIHRKRTETSAPVEYHMIDIKQQQERIKHPSGKHFRESEESQLRTKYRTGYGR
jgi:hypothetical protein